MTPVNPALSTRRICVETARNVNLLTGKEVVRVRYRPEGVRDGSDRGRTARRGPPYRAGAYGEDGDVVTHVYHAVTHAERASVKRDVTPGRCPYCGYRCDGETCAQHADLPALDVLAPGVGNSVEGGDK